jgi:hypothetical protein
MEGIPPFYLSNWSYDTDLISLCVLGLEKRNRNDTFLKILVIVPRTCCELSVGLLKTSCISSVVLYVNSIDIPPNLLVLVVGLFYLEQILRIY